MKEPDFARAAAELIAIHGETAEMMAAEFMDRALERSDETGFNEWTRIATLVAQSLRPQPRKSASPSQDELPAAWVFVAPRKKRAAG